MPVFKGVVLEHLFISASNYLDGLKRVLSYQRLISDAIDLQLIEEDEEVYLSFHYPDAEVVLFAINSYWCMIDFNFDEEFQY